MSVTVVSCVYGIRYAGFFKSWWNNIQLLDPAPDAAIVSTDGTGHPSGPTMLYGQSDWKHPQAFHLHNAISHAETDWVWISDVDDIPMTDALQGIDDVEADVWQMGYVTAQDGSYAPPTLTADEYLALDGNPFVGSSAIRVDAYRAAGGFPDAAFQDWGLWRRLARNGATFQSSGRAHFHYVRHPDTRGALELTQGRRMEHLQEMALAS